MRGLCKLIVKERYEYADTINAMDMDYMECALRWGECGDFWA